MTGNASAACYPGAVSWVYCGAIDINIHHQQEVGHVLIEKDTIQAMHSNNQTIYFFIFDTLVPGWDQPPFGGILNIVHVSTAERTFHLRRICGSTTRVSLLQASNEFLYIVNSFTLIC